MALKETTNQLNELLSCVQKDLEKGSNGNKAASQRVRVATIQLAKLAKVYRKESIASERRKKTSAKNAVSKTKATKKVAAKKAVKKTVARGKSKK